MDVYIFLVFWTLGHYADVLPDPKAVYEPRGQAACQLRADKINKSGKQGAKCVTVNVP